LASFERSGVVGGGGFIFSLENWQRNNVRQNEQRYGLSAYLLAKKNHMIKYNHLIG
jgi:hypothetical protein